MKTIEEKAREYADKAIDYNVYTVMKSTWNAFRSTYEKAYLAGATEAISSQWRNVDDELPEESELVLCLMKSNGAIVSGYITKRWHGYPEVATDGGFHFEDYGGYECTHWMPLPQCPVS